MNGKAAGVQYWFCVMYKRPSRIKAFYCLAAFDCIYLAFIYPLKYFTADFFFQLFYEREEK